MDSDSLCQRVDPYQTSPSACRSCQSRNANCRLHFVSIVAHDMAYPMIASLTLLGRFNSMTA